MGLGFIMSVLVGGFAGWIGSRMMNAHTGIFMNILLGIVGAVVLNALLGAVGIYAERSWLPQLIVGAGGAAMLIAVGRKFRD